MSTLNFIRGSVRMPRPLRLTILFSNMLILLINLFVGLLVYQNPLVVLSDMDNLTSLFLFGLILSAGLWVLHMVFSFFEKRNSYSS